MNSAFSFHAKPVLTRRPRTTKFLCCHGDKNNNATNNANGDANRNSNEASTSRRAFLSGVVRLSGAASVMSVASDALAAADELLAASTASGAATKTAARKLTWGYVDEIGPNKWGQLSDEWRICDMGKYQSPIELSYKSSRLAEMDELRPTISTASSTGRAKFCVKHKEPGPYAANKWLVIEPYVEPPPSIIGDAPPLDIPSAKSPVMLTLPNVGKYRLKKVHFHTNGSEHVLNGQRSAMEAHFVFGLDRATTTTTTATNSDPTSVIPDKDTKEEPRGTGAGFVVVGVLINEEQATSPWLASVLETAIKPDTNEANEELYGKTGVYLELDVDDLLPNFNESNLYTYDGSLTTPPGSEGIHWIVMNDRASVTKQDCSFLQEFQGGPNTRPLQNANEREVVQFAAVVAENEAMEPTAI